MADLEGIIFRNPLQFDADNPYQDFETAELYLSGNVRAKLDIAQVYAKSDERFNVNVASLEAVQPKDLTADQIDVRIGTTWISEKYYLDFVNETFEPTSDYLRTEYSDQLDRYVLENKSFYGNSFKATNVWGGISVDGLGVPWGTLFISVVLFVVIPLSAGWLTRLIMTKNKGREYFEKRFIPKFNNITIIGLLLTLVIIFSFQGRKIVEQPANILLIALPLTIQTFLIFFIAYLWSKAWKLPHNVASPGGMIGASNFFELAVAVAISFFGLQSPAALVTIVGVLVEVPIMLTLVKIANKTVHWFPVKQQIEEVGITK